MLPGPGGVGAAVFLVVGVGFEAGHQQARAAVGPQRGVDLEQIAFTGLHGEPVDQLAHQRGIDFGGALVVVVEHEHQVQIAAVAQLFAAQLAVGDNAEQRRVAVLLAQQRPAPAQGDAQHAVGHGGQIIGHLFDGDAAFQVAHQGAKQFGVVAAAQQIEQRFLVVLAGAGQRLAAPFQLALEGGGVEAVAQQAGAGQLVDHAGVAHDIARGPPRGTQHAQQAFMHGGAFQQQRQIAVAAQQRFDPVQQAQHADFGDAAFLQPLAGALHQPPQAGARGVAQRLHARQFAPFVQAFVHAGRKQGLHAVQIRGGGRGGFLLAGALAVRRALAQQAVKFLGHELAVGVQLAQEIAGAAKAQGAGDPVEVGVVGRQHVGLLVVQVLDAVFDPAQEHVGAGQRVGGVAGHQAGARQALERFQRGARAQFGKLAAAHHLQQLHREFDLADAAARQLDVVGPLGPAGAALAGVVANLLVQRAQRLEHAVVQVAAKHEGQHHTAQGQR